MPCYSFVFEKNACGLEKVILGIGWSYSKSIIQLKGCISDVIDLLAQVATIGLHDIQKTCPDGLKRELIRVVDHIETINTLYKCRSKTDLERLEVAEAELGQCVICLSQELALARSFYGIEGVWY